MQEHSPVSIRLMMALTPKRLFLSLCISISLLRPYTFFSRSPLVFKTLFVSDFNCPSSLNQSVLIWTAGTNRHKLWESFLLSGWGKVSYTWAARNFSTSSSHQLCACHIGLWKSTCFLYVFFIVRENGNHKCRAITKTNALRLVTQTPSFESLQVCPFLGLFLTGIFNLLSTP